MRFCSLSSSSYANSVVIQDNRTCVLIDCGLRKRDIKPFLGSVGLSPGDIDAVLVTHSHADHVYGLKFLLKENNVPVYSTAGVLREINSRYSFSMQPNFQVMQLFEEIGIGSMSLIPFRLSHDVETIGFFIKSGAERMGVITDTGFVPDNCIKAFETLDYLYIESNHDIEMYRYSSKPRHVIKRNLGPNGHLSNGQCGEALESMGLNKCKLVTLAHLSEDDNNPSRALESATRHLVPGTALVCAPSRVPGRWSDLLLK
ncbi:MAG: hypothetical protein VR69_03265 [Peptococcaceae bacterium BRH_c4b]|nr:MAG: hypothetical protein VR69_03265 [Peptococcaceae bacterium BRH_c4b]